MDNIAGPAPNPETTSGAEPALSPPAKPGPFFGRTDWQSFCLTSLLIFVVYLFTLSPSVELGDSGIFATGAMYAGVPDCPGFPLWTIYAHCFTVLLPFSNIAWRISVSSAFASAIACGLIALLVSRLGALVLEGIRNFQSLPPKSEKWLRLISGYAAGMSFGLSGAVWSHSVIVDWWPLTFACFAAILCLLLRWSCAPEKTRYLYAAIFLYGLTLTNSQSLISAAFGLELLILFVNRDIGRDLFAVTTLLLIHFLFITNDSAAPSLWFILLALTILCGLIALGFTLKTRAVFTRWRTVLGLLLLATLGFSLYLYCAIASMTNPPMNWGYPRTVEGFYHLIERGQYEKPYPVDNLPRYWDQIRLYYEIISTDYGCLYLLAAIVPFFFLHRLRAPDRNRLFGLFAVFLCESFFLLALLNPSFDRASRDLQKIYFAPSYLILAVWTGLGLILLGSTARPKAPEMSATHL